MKPTILVTGGTGYIGSHTVVELMQEGYGVIIVDDLSNSDIHVLDGIEKITGRRPQFEKFDLCNEKRVMKFFRDHTGASAIIHFAAHKAVGESVNKPLKYYRNNLLSLIHLLQGMEEHGIPHMVFSSSCTVYGQPERLPVTEDAPVQKPGSPYGNTKKISEEILYDFIQACRGKNCISLRYFNPIGAHPSAHIGELPPGVPDNLVPYITQTAIGLRKELLVFGHDYDTPDGTAIRDYLHVVDLARAHVAAIARLLEGRNTLPFEVFNLGTGHGYSVLEVIQSFERVSGVKLNYRFTGRRAGDIEKVWADASLANRELGWVAVKSLDEAMLSAWNWEQQLRKKKP